MAVFWKYIMTLQTTNVYILKNYMETEWGDKEKGIISMTSEILEAKEHTLLFGKSPGPITIAW